MQLYYNKKLKEKSCIKMDVGSGGWMKKAEHIPGWGPQMWRWIIMWKTEGRANFYFKKYFIWTNFKLQGSKNSSFMSLNTPSPILTSYKTTWQQSRTKKLTLYSTGLLTKLGISSKFPLSYQCAFPGILSRTPHGG